MQVISLFTFHLNKNLNRMKHSNIKLTSEETSVQKNYKIIIDD